MFPPERSIFIFLGPCHKVVLVPQDKIWEHCIPCLHPEELDSLVQTSSSRWRLKVIGGGGLWLSQTPELPARENTAALVQVVRTATRLQRWRRSNAGRLPDALPEHCSFVYSWCLKIHIKMSLQLQMCFKNATAIVIYSILQVHLYFRFVCFLGMCPLLLCGPLLPLASPQNPQFSKFVVL